MSNFLFEFARGLVAIMREARHRHRVARRRAQFRRAIVRLPAPQAQIYKLHCVDQIPVAAVAKQLAMTPAEVETQLVAALVALAAGAPR